VARGGGGGRGRPPPPPAARRPPAAGDVEGENRLVCAMLIQGADVIERTAQAVEGADITSVVTEINAFARRQPAVFLGASVAIGFVLARVGKTAVEQASSAAKHEPPNPEL